MSTHLCLASRKMDIDKQYRPGSDATEHGVWSGSTLFAFRTGIVIKYVNNKTIPTRLILERNRSKESTRHKWVNAYHMRKNLNFDAYIQYIFTPSLFQLTYGGASPLLSDRTRFPRLFRLVAPDSRYNLARLALAGHFNWKKIATINVALDYFSAVWYIPRQNI